MNNATWKDPYGLSYERACELEGVTDYPKKSCAIIHFGKLTSAEQEHVIACLQSELKDARQELKDAYAAEREAAKVSRKLGIEHKPYTEPRKLAKQRIVNLEATLARLQTAAAA